MHPFTVAAGGKKGVDMAGMSDLGGVKFFNLAVDTPEGDIEVLELVMQGEHSSSSGTVGKAGNWEQCLPAALWV